MNRTLLTVFVLTICNGFAAEADTSQSDHANIQFDHEVLLEESGKMRMKWTYTDTDITFEVTGKTLGWMGIGISPTGTMEDADIAFMFVDKRGTPILSDWFGIKVNLFGWETFNLTRDESQDLALIYGYERDGHTTVAFHRKLMSCNEQDRIITEDTMKVIWALNENSDPAFYNPSDGNDFPLSYYPDYHTDRGAKSIRLIGYTPPEPSLTSDDVKTINVVADAFALPSGVETYYYCKFTKSPIQEGIKHHILKFQPIIENRKVVHHFNIFECSTGAFDADERYQRSYYKCDDAKFSLDTHVFCRTIFVWTAGGGPLIMPEGVGLSFGEDDKSYLVIQIHYNNPTFDDGIIDNSGVSIHYTSMLRQETAGLLYTGVTPVPYHVIAPGAANWISRALCPKECLSAAMAQAGINEINIFAVGPHTHGTGRKIRLGVIRNGTELKPLLRDDHYDTDYQYIASLEDVQNLQTGDYLYTECVYDTTKRTNVTFGGPASADEMCTAQVYYYPKINLPFCTSFTDPNSLYKMAGAKIKSEGNNFQQSIYNSEDGQQVKEVILAKSWNHLSRFRMMKKLLRAPFRSICASPQSVTFPRTPPKKVRKYRETKQCK